MLAHGGLSNCWGFLFIILRSLLYNIKCLVTTVDMILHFVHIFELKLISFLLIKALSHIGLETGQQPLVSLRLLEKNVYSPTLFASSCWRLLAVTVWNHSHKRYCTKRLLVMISSWLPKSTFKILYPWVNGTLAIDFTANFQPVGEYTETDDCLRDWGPKMILLVNLY